ncbi:MAG: molybdopterin-dependent oxidoreductase [Candidatus Polarisedimenticolaceae bacterium]|nr:molybdopterin-dependent oxidoreductase [Candidatus Polarisedimenticolaceae bacterium]
MSDYNRRDFLKVGATAGAVAACPSVVQAMELKLGGADFHQLRTFHEREKAPYLCTLCPYVCGGFSYAEKGEVMKAEGNPDHIATRGKFCGKGQASLFSASDPDRILSPLKRIGARGEGKWAEISWEEAIATVAESVSGALNSDVNSIVFNEGAFREGAGARFMDTLGSSSLIRSRTPSIGNNAKQTALKNMLGADFAYPDLEHTRYVLNFGSNIMETGMPLASRLTDGMVNNRLKIVTFDVRLSHTAGRSDEWIPVFPGSDGLIALAMANVIMQEGMADTAFIDAWTNTTSADLAEQLKAYTPAMAAKASGVDAADIRRIAIEFARWKPAVVFSQNGVSSHAGGIDAESACTLLSVITGNIDSEGGLCLPRAFDIAMPQPVPEKATDSVTLNVTFPFDVKTGVKKVSVLFNHMSNPAYSSPATSFWREVLKDKKLIPLIVDFTPFMSETSEYADIILPDVVGIERHDVASSPTALLPWASMSMPKVAVRGAAKDVRETLKAIIEAVDADGSRGMTQYWAFADAEDWVKQSVAATPELKDGYKKLKKKGLWPLYGTIDLNSRKIVKDGAVVKAPYGTYQAAGFATASGKIEVPTLAWQPNTRLAAIKDSEFVLSTYKVSYHSGSKTTNLKLLSEMWHSNPLWINKEVAKRLGIADGALVRVTSEVGHLVTKAWVTHGIHPQVVGISTSVGRSSYGRVALADPTAIATFAKEEQRDADLEANLWWRDLGTNPNDIIPLAVDPVSGIQAWNDTVVSIAPAKEGDTYGDVRVDNVKHLAIYKKSIG